FRWLGEWIDPVTEQKPIKWLDMSGWDDEQIPERKWATALLARYERDGRNVSDKPTSPTYAPALFCKERDANGMRKEDFASAMRRLSEAGKIHVENYGRPSRPASRIRQGRKDPG